MSLLSTMHRDEASVKRVESSQTLAKSPSPTLPRPKPQWLVGELVEAKPEERTWQLETRALTSFSLKKEPSLAQNKVHLCEVSLFRAAPCLNSVLHSSATYLWANK